MASERVKLADIRERDEKATPGPWAYVVRCDGRAWIDLPGIDGHAFGMHGFGHEAVFIAHARQDVPALLDALDAVLAVKFDTRVNPWSTDTDHGFAQGMALAKERVLSAIESVIDLEGDGRG